MISLQAIVQGRRDPSLRTVEVDGLAAVISGEPAPLSAEALRAHEAAVRRIAESADACLPARFGAAAEDEEALRTALAARSRELLEALALVRGREQMTLRVHGVTAPLNASSGSGTRYLEERRRARKFPELDPLRAALSKLVRAERVERHSEPGLLASVYHLVDKGAAPQYARVAEGVKLEGLRVLVSGPWPPWSFAPEVAP